MKNGLKKFKLNNEGSAIVTVIIVTLFLSILVTTFLYLSGMNFFMKATDRNIKENFYDAEVVLEDVKATLAVKVSEASDRAYNEVMKSYATLDHNTRNSEYYMNFFNAFENEWNSNVAAYLSANTSAEEADAYESILKGWVQVLPEDAYTLHCTGGLDVSKKSEGYLIIRNVRLEYKQDGITTIIETDFLISAPALDFGVDNGSDSATEKDRTVVNMADCVQYLNWVRK